MKLVRKVKKTVLYIDMTDPRNPKGFEKVEYEDVLEDSTFKKLLKSWTTWVILFGSIVLGLGVIFTDSKWWGIFLFQLFNGYVFMGYRHYKNFKDQHIED